MSLIQVKNVTFGYEGQTEQVFENLSFRVDSTWKLGCVGKNGCGKTTLLRLLAKQYAYHGQVISNLPFCYFPFKISSSDKMVSELFEEIAPYAEIWQYKKELFKLSVDEDCLYLPYEYLSGGEQIKVLLAALFLREGEFFLIDEPTNHLDLHSRKVIANYLNTKKGFILVSHDRELLDSCIDHILVFSQNGVQVQQGNFSTWYENHRRKLQYETKENEKLRKEIRRLKIAETGAEQRAQAIEKTKYHHGPIDRGYAGHKSAKQMKRAKQLESRISQAQEKTKELLNETDKEETLKIHPQHHFSKTLFSARNLSLYYGEKAVCKHIDLEICQGERIALCGQNGAGKTTLLKFIHDPDHANIRFEGEFYRAKDINVSVVSQNSYMLSGSLREFIQSRQIDETLCKSILRKLGFKRELFEYNLEDYSDGQKKKVLIAGSLCDKAHLYLWDEPLNFIDIFARKQIETLLLTYHPTILLIEHDHYFIQKVSTKTYKL